MPQELQIKAIISDLERKWDKNLNPFYRLSLQGCANYFYAFSYGLPEETLTALQTSPKLVNQLALITYEELPNQNNSGTFFKVKQIQVL